MESSITLWQFLLQLLLDQSHKHLICWTSNDGEFKLLKSEEVARLWGLRKNKTNMNYDKLSRALRYYYDKNIIRKVIGQKFVYKFVSFPDILKLDPHAVEMGQEFGRTLVTKTEAQEIMGAHVKEEVEEEDVEVKEEYVEEEDEEGVCHGSEAISAALQVQARYQEYLRSGIYASLPFGGPLQAPAQLLHHMRPRQGESRGEESPSVIHFVAQTSADSRNGGRGGGGGSSLSSRCSSSSEPSLSSYRPSKTSPHPSSSSSSSSSPSTSAPTSAHPWRSPKQEVDDSEQDLQPLNLSSGRRDSPHASDRRSSEALASSSTSASASSGSPSASRSRKPKGLVISNPSMVLAGCDLGSIALNSPALPSGSLTPGLLSAQTAPGLLLSPSPLLTSLQLWNSLSPAGPLSPNHLQGHPPLFQFPTLLNGYMTVPVSSLDGSASPIPMLLSSTNHKS